MTAVTSRSFSKNPMLRQKLQTRFPNVKFNESGNQLIGDDLAQFLQGAEQAIIGLELIDAQLLDRCPDLKLICKMGTGIDKIDQNALERRGILFSATPGINKRSVSELVLALILMLQRHLPVVCEGVKQGIWKQPSGQCLSNKTVGIIGFGAVGQDLASLLAAFNCQCLVFDVRQYETLPSQVSQVDMGTLLKQSDIISIHLPFISENYHFLAREEFIQMKKGAIVINTARGGLIDEAALYEALASGHLTAAAMDVFEQEPLVPQNLLKLDQFIATSHIGGSTQEAIEAMGLMAVNFLEKMSR